MAIQTAHAQVLARKNAGGGGASFSDNFNRANEDPLAAPWETPLGSHGDIKLISNEVTGNGGSNSVARVSVGTGRTFAAAQWASIELLASNTDFNGPVVNCDGSGNGYACAYAGGGSFNIYKMASGGSFTQVGASIAGATAVATDILKLQSDGTGVLTVFLNGASQGSRTDGSSPYTSGQPGLWCNSSGKCDNFDSADV